MANRNIPNLAAATTPLAGTEKFPLWDGTQTAWALVSDIGPALKTHFDSFITATETLASAATLDLTTVEGTAVEVTGTTTVTAVTLDEGQTRTVRFVSGLTLTHGATLVLPDLLNIKTLAGDFAIFRGFAAGVVRCIAYLPIKRDTNETLTSATTLDLTALAGDVIDVTGTTTVAAITLREGMTKKLCFTGALVLTNGASLTLPGGANITTVAGDFAEVRGYAGGVVRCVSYTFASSGAAILAATIHAATSKTPPVDADEIPLVDSAATFGLKRLTWANLKTTVYAAVGGLIVTGTGKTTPVDADALVIGDSAASNATKTLTWANLKATLATWLGGGTIAGVFTSLTAKTELAISAAASVYLKFQTSGSNRWLWGKDGTETGSNAGSNLYLHRYTDTGAYAGTVMVCNRSDGAVTIYGLLVTDITATGTITSAGGASFLRTTNALTSGAAANTATLTNAPSTGNPSKWIGINDAGTIRYIPCW